VPVDYKASDFIKLVIATSNTKIISFRLLDDPSLFDLFLSDPITNLPDSKAKPIPAGRKVYEIGESFCLVEKLGANASVSLLDHSPIEPSSLNSSIDSINLF
jgi:hypothetical protein